MKPERVSIGAGEIRMPVDVLTRDIVEILVKIGCPRSDAEIVAGELVLSDQMGVSSHGVVRVAEYVAGAKSGHVIPGGACSILSESPGTVLVDGGRNFGQVVGRFALEVGIERVREKGTVCVVTRNSYHLGRVGALAERATSQNLICIALVAVGLPGVVAAWGGAEPVLGTNPIAYGVPLDDGVVVTDFATSTSAEGAVRLAARSERELPEGVLLDSAGEPTTDPKALFTSPPGAILPFGGAQGYKGYALNLLPELTAAALAGYGPHDPSRPSNCLFLLLVDPNAFLPVETFKRLAGDSARMVKASRPRAGQRVRLPGEPERENLAVNSTEVTVTLATLDSLRKTAAVLDVKLSV